MADGRHLKKPLNRQKNQDGAARHLEKSQKSRYFRTV